MEDNVADALKMAAAVLLFVFALGLAISSFSQARQTIDNILSYTDREYEYTYVEQNGGTERVVGVETIIPVIYRSLKENYKIYFYKNESKTDEYVLYEKTDTDGTKKPINFIDLERKDIVNFGNDKQEEDFIMALLYGNNLNGYRKNFGEIDGYFWGDDKIRLNSKGLYDIIIEDGNRFIEQIGEYYQQEVGESSESLTPDANKTKKRVYTYILKN